ncbi:MAG: hypothetical protein Q7U38_09305 [Methylobacter sp.]|nr:hypothetical protein [Methylobacter sp.]MDP2100503.1 hypothetical protein [Methylobacter sp.]MDP2428744.1 hypothetical protein [Methylobacter sp.]MDP3053240.1 hypothetical protein [Methylobacter sp.]MDP3361561.1 hypothetical protein [Methylobacter sp.]
MTEGLFILTTIFVAYVAYAIVGEQRDLAKAKSQPVSPETPKTTAVQATTTAEEKPAVTANKAAAPKPPAKPATTKTAPKAKAKTKAATTKPAAAEKAPVTAAPSTGLKNPQTGEVATAYSNYRFTKRWIKDALVAEGLLDKVYKNNELNPETEAKIKQAVAKLETMGQYRA